MDIAAALDRALRTAGIAILGVSIGNPLDKLTWKIAYDGIPTPPVVAAAEAVIAAFDIGSVQAVKGEMRLLLEHLISHGIVVQGQLPPELQALLV
jgi:hypothetical protein